MTPPAVMTERPRLFAVETVTEAPSRSLEDAVLDVLSRPDDAVCLICGGATHAVSGGAECEQCGAELLMGPEPVVLWAA
jgi:hypothetical protein